MKGVSPNVYTREYYLTINDGGALSEQDSTLSPRLEYMLNLANLKTTSSVLDVGCGSGELCLNAAESAKEVIGIDYSEDAIELCNEKLKAAPRHIRERVRFIRTDVKRLTQEVKNKKFDVVFLTDVVEHLYPEELEKMFLDLKKLLAKNGTVYIHTAPNLDFYKYGYPLIRFSYPLLRHIPPARSIVDTKPNWKGRKRLPKDPEDGSHNKVGHVNEQTPKALKNTLKSCGYESQIKVLPFLRAVTGAKIRLIYAALSLPVVKKMFGAEIVAIAKVKE